MKRTKPPAKPNFSPDGEAIEGEALQQVALILEVTQKTIYKYIPAAEQRKLKNLA